MLLLIASMLVAALPAVQAEDSNPLHAQLEGPMVLTTGQRAMYTLTMVGGPAEMGNGNYSWKGTLVGEDTTDSFLAPSSGGPLASGLVRFNLTAPAVPQTLTIRINCTSYNSAETLTAQVEYKVLVVEPVVLSATITNTGDVGATGVPLTLQIEQDGQWMEFYSTTLDLTAGESYDFLYNWTALDLEPGAHKVRMLLDPGNTIVTFEGGSAVYETTIYYDMPGYGGMNTLLWVLIIALAAVSFLLWRRPAPKGKRKR